MLHGYGDVPIADAFHFAALRAGKNVLIDASKDLEWARLFLKRDDLDVKFVHVVRHPCGFVESSVRRYPDVSYETALDQWEATNRAIEAFVAEAGVPSMTVIYDELADDPEQTFPELCAFIGGAWEPAALEYWKVEHHGLGGNGAASVYLRHRKHVNFITRDDAFYAGMSSRPPAADRRWQERVPADVLAAALSRPYARELIAVCAPKSWLATPTGDVPTRSLPDRYANALPIGAEHYRAYVGPPAEYDAVGAAQFRLITTLGLREHHRVLDFGCGSLRLGRLLIPYLSMGNYYGLDPNRWLIDDAIERQIGQSQIIIKVPKFFYADDFRADACGAAFDYIVAQSILSHAGTDILRRSLEGFARALAPSGLALVTVVLPEQNGGIVSDADGWVYPECVAYAQNTLQEMFRDAGLYGRAIPFHHPRQTWYVLARDESRIPPPEFDVHLSGETIDSFGTRPS